MNQIHRYEKKHKKTVIDGRVDEVMESLLKFLRQRCGTNTQHEYLDKMEQKVRDLKVQEVVDPSVQRAFGMGFNLKINGFQNVKGVM